MKKAAVHRIYFVYNLFYHKVKFMHACYLFFLTFSFLSLECMDVPPAPMNAEPRKCASVHDPKNQDANRKGGPPARILIKHGHVSGFTRAPVVVSVP